jgi:hypothetical protein
MVGLGIVLSGTIAGRAFGQLTWQQWFVADFDLRSGVAGSRGVNQGAHGAVARRRRDLIPSEDVTSTVGPEPPSGKRLRKWCRSLRSDSKGRGLGPREDLSDRGAT